MNKEVELGPGYFITLRTAAKFYPFLTQSDSREDVKQVAHLVDLQSNEETRETVRLANRELYRLARDLGWRKVNRSGSWNHKVWKKN